MKVAAINCSYFGMKPGDVIYNLGVDKIANYHRQLGDEVYVGPWSPMVLDDQFYTKEIDKFYFSVIFTWDIPAMILAVNLVREWGKEVEIGGPAATFMHTYIHKQTGVEPHYGLDARFEHVPGSYQLTFTSRGCPWKCLFCGVRKVEPVAIEYDDFPLANKIGDNNILATSWGHQELVVNKMVNIQGDIDINSGFDVRFFKEEHFNLYKRLRLFYWRFAFDTMDVEADVRRVAALLREDRLDRHHVTFYCLIGFPGTKPRDAFYRLNTIIELGMNPYPMRFWPLNALKRDYVAPGWTNWLLENMSAYYQTPYLWKADSWENYRPEKRKRRQEEIWKSLISGAF